MIKVISSEGIVSIVTICWATLFLYWLVSSFFVRRSVIPRGPWWIIWRVVVVLIAIAFIRLTKLGNQYFISLFRLLFQSSFRLLIPGSVFAIFGLLGAIWARAYLGKNWSAYPTYKEHQELVTTGPYRFVRHPIYTSIMLMYIGTILYYGSLFISVMFVIVAVCFILRAKKEEEIMIKLFGRQYIGYMKRTKTWIPWIY